LRDIPGDTGAGKRTLAVVLGDGRTRLLWLALVTGAHALGVVIVASAGAWALLSLAGVPIAVRAAVPVTSGARGRDLVPVLQLTGLAELVYAAGLGLGLAIAA